MGVLGVELRRLGLHGSSLGVGPFHGYACSGNGIASSGNALGVESLRIFWKWILALRVVYPGRGLGILGVNGSALEW